MNNKIQNKLFQYEVTPPSNVWDKIVVQLDEKSSLPLKLLSFAKNPPGDIWNKITMKLDNKNKVAKVIPFYARYSKPLKYSGAIVSIFILVVATSLLIGKKTISEEHPSIVQEQKITNSPVLNNNINIASAALTGIQMQKFKNAVISKKNVLLRHFIPSESLEILSDLKSIIPQFAERKNNFDYNPSVSQYIVYSDDAGNAVRLNKKLYEVFACTFADINCKDHIQQLQEKTASSALASDFTGMLDILNNLKENQ